MKAKMIRERERERDAFSENALNAESTDAMNSAQFGCALTLSLLTPFNRWPTWCIWCKVPN